MSATHSTDYEIRTNKPFARHVDFEIRAAALAKFQINSIGYGPKALSNLFAPMNFLRTL